MFFSFFRQPAPGTPSSSLETLLRQAAPDWWQSLDPAMRQTLTAGTLPLLQHARSPRHLLWHTGDALYQSARNQLNAAEATAQAALSASGDAIDQMLAYTVLIRVYASQPDDQERCVEICYQALEHAEAFRRAWQQRAEQQGSEPDGVAIPRLEAFEWLIGYYERCGDFDRAAEICRRAVAAGYPEYQRRIQVHRWRYAGENAGAFIRGMLALGATTAMLQLNDARSADFEVYPISTLLTLVLWGITIALAIPSVLRETILDVPRALRRRPALFWLLCLIALMGIPMHSELLKFVAPYQSYDTWMLLWGVSLLLFGGLTGHELRAMSRRLSLSRYTGVMVSLTTLVLLLIGGELFLRYGVIFSNSYARGLIHQRWVANYWNPLNELTYRDYAPVVDAEAGVKRVLVVGDSFAGGFGINNIDDTFPHLLKPLLGEGFRVNVAGVPGWNTQGELEGLTTYPYQPDILIWSYFLNDIAEVDPEQEDGFQSLFPQPPDVIKPYVDFFYLGEFLYWNIYRQVLAGGDNGYGDLIRNAYSQPEIWEAHAADLNKVIDYAADHSISMVVIIWPVLTGVEQSAAMTRQVEAVFTARNVPVVNMVDYVKGYSAPQLVVNPFDMHPGPLAQRLAADALFRAITARPSQN